MSTSDLSALSAFATRRCGSRCAVTISDASVVHAPAGGLDIAKPVTEIAGLFGEWIADERLVIFFSTKSLSAKWALRGSCSFWDSRLVRFVSFCDGESSSSQPLPAVR
ncbi:hypothetical protein V1292_000593 [Bradyrhizobium sp. AZCC 1719]|uniref:hypothetical protein n=1 Tax=Bradyrhizobium sp. AZCC 1719 TaxID=3117028 RepID=UPI002FEEA8C0